MRHIQVLYLHLLFGHRGAATVKLLRIYYAHAARCLSASCSPSPPPIRPAARACRPTCSRSPRLGCHPLSVADRAHRAGHARRRRAARLDPESIAEQARACWRTCRSPRSRSACVGGAPTREAIAAILAAHPRVPVVLDPVLASGRGDALADERDARRPCAPPVLPRTTVLTPNSLEARALARRPIAALADCARALRPVRSCSSPARTSRHARGGEHALRRGRPGARGSLAAPARQLPRLGLHARLGARRAPRARRLDVPEAARAAQEYTWQALAARLSARRAASYFPSLLRRDMKLRGLYAITPDAALAPRSRLPRQRAAGARGAVSRAAVSRKKSRTRRSARARRARSRSCAARHGVPLIVNDDVELALAVGADGRAPRARRRRPRRSARALPGQAARCLVLRPLDAGARARSPAGADYVAFGSVFRLAHQARRGARAARAVRCRRNLGVPLVAIGGITLENAPQVLAAGADCARGDHRPVRCARYRRGARALTVSCSNHDHHLQRHLSSSARSSASRRA